MGIASPGIHLTSSGKLMIAYLETFLATEIVGLEISYLELETSLKTKVTYGPKKNFPNVFERKEASLNLYVETEIEMRMTTR